MAPFRRRHKVDLSKLGRRSDPGRDRDVRTAVEHSIRPRKSRTGGSGASRWPGGLIGSHSESVVLDAVVTSYSGGRFLGSLVTRLSGPGQGSRCCAHHRPSPATTVQGGNFVKRGAFAPRSTSMPQGTTATSGPVLAGRPSSGGMLVDSRSDDYRGARFVQGFGGTADSGSLGCAETTLTCGRDVPMRPAPG